MCRKTGSDCRKWVPLFSPPPPPGQQLTSLLWRPCQPPAPSPPRLRTCGRLGSPGSQMPCLGRPGSHAGRGAEVQRWQGSHLPVSSPSSAGQVQTHRKARRRSSFSALLASACLNLSLYLILPLHKLCPAVQALNGVHSVLSGHLLPVSALWHAIPLLPPPAARDEKGQGQVRNKEGKT